MPAPTPPTAIDAVPPTPDRNEGEVVFVPKMYNFLDYFAPFKAYLQLVVTYCADAITWVAGLATAAEDSATASEASRQAADAVSNYKGDWSGLTGALAKPATVSNGGAFWALVNNLANVALSQPSPSNADWRFVSGTRWLPTYTSSANIIPNAYSPVQATVSPVNMTLVSMTTGDFVVVQNSQISTQTVTIVNTMYTIRGSAGSISSGTDIVLNPGDTAHFRVAASNILEAVEHA